MANDDIFLAILAMDAYNRGYSSGIELPDAKGTQIGSATISKTIADIVGFSANAEAIGFYAVAYDTPDGTVISYRGTDNPTFNPFDETGDVWRGWLFGTGLTLGTQLTLAQEFYEEVTENNVFEGEGGATLTGHSLGGGLAGHIAALSHSQAVIFDHEPFAAATKGEWLSASRMAISRCQRWHLRERIFGSRRRFIESSS